MKWHDLLGAVLVDFFDGTPYTVETEVDLSVKKQLLDIVVIQKGNGALHRDLPDGMSPLAKYNLISFKSFQDTFDSWALFELIGHFVNYRKRVSPSLNELLPEEDFRLFAIAARYPDKLGKETPFESHHPGVYDILCGPMRIRLVVIRNLENRPANAMLELFSTVPEQIQYACRQYRPYSPHTTGIVEQLIRKYREEDVKMATTLEDIHRKIIRETPLKQRLEGVTTGELLEVVSAQELVKEIPPEVMLNAIPPEAIEKFMKAAKKPKATKQRKPRK